MANGGSTSIALRKDMMDIGTSNTKGYRANKAGTYGNNVSILFPTSGSYQDRVPTSKLNNKGGKSSSYPTSVDNTKGYKAALAAADDAVKKAATFPKTALANTLNNLTNTYGGGSGGYGYSATPTPTTVTTNTTETTKNKYNTDYGSLDWLRPDAKNSIYNPIWERATLNTIDQMAAEMGYHNPYTYEDLFDQVYYPGALAKLNQANAGTRMAQNRFNQGLSGISDAVMDAYREQDIGRIASGTSRGAMAANLYKNILGLEQESMADVTDLANQYYQNYADYGANIAQAYEDAYNGSTAAQQYLADYADNYYWQQQQSLDARYANDVNLASQRYAADADTYISALNALMSQLIESTTTSKTTQTQK